MQPAATTAGQAPGAGPAHKGQNAKRLIVCCDGTWMNSDTGYVRPSIFNPIGQLQIPSNVTRISRLFKRLCPDGTVQIINYQCGVGTGSTWSDVFTGGAFGRGIAEHIREAYSYICANYVDGDEIILIGFSRGAFTARSVAGMIGNLGLLTREGMEFYYPIFKDMENWMTPGYADKDPFPTKPFTDKPTGPTAPYRYREKLLKKGLTRVYQDQGKGEPIKVKAVAVWDTVGSLGIPRTDILSRLGIKNSTQEYTFYDTNLSDRIEHAFHALALDETRPPFSPAVWERKPENRMTTDLRQVWFPGNHGNVGGGWADQGVSDISLAWMMDQLASVGVEFDDGSINRVFKQTHHFYIKEARKMAHKLERERQRRATCGGAISSLTSLFSSRRAKWAMEPIYGNNAPVRPWALGAIQAAGGFIYTLAGRRPRSPGMYRRINPDTGKETDEFLLDTNERVHPSVRVRLAVSGLGLNDKGFWECPALLGRWRLCRTDKRFYDPVPKGGRLWGPQVSGAVGLPGGENEAEEELEEEMAAEMDEISPVDVSDDRRNGGRGRGHHHGRGRGNGKDAAAATTNGDHANGDHTDGDHDHHHRQLSPGAADRHQRWVWEYQPRAGEKPPLQTLLVEEPLGPYERHLLRLAGGRPNVYQFAEGGVFDAAADLLDVVAANGQNGGGGHNGAGQKRLQEEEEPEMAPAVPVGMTTSAETEAETAPARAARQALRGR